MRLTLYALAHNLGYLQGVQKKVSLVNIETFKFKFKFIIRSQRNLQIQHYNN